MMSPSLPGSACSPNLSRVKCGSGLSPIAPAFTSFGRYADIGSRRIESSRPGLRLHVGSTSTLYLEKGTLLGMNITYLSQVWSAWDPESTQAFYEQVLPYIQSESLRPLMGICAPTIIGLYNASAGRLSLAMELPHPVGWRQADPQISAELKEKVVIAYQNIHNQGILHNDVKLENMLIGDDHKVTIVDFCKMVVDPEPADLVLEMRVVRFMLDYDGAKEVEYERLRKAESRVEKNLWRSRLRRAAESQELAGEVAPDDPPSQDEVASPPFSGKFLMRWDSEVTTEDTTHCPGWKGKRFEVPEDMRNPLWPGAKVSTPPTPPPYRSTSHPGLVKEPSGSRSQRTKHCRYFPCLWSPLPESAAPGLKGGTAPSSTTSSGSSDYGGFNEHSSTTTAEPTKRDRTPTPPLFRKRSRIGEFNRPDGYPYGNKRARRSKSPESVIEHEVDPASWATHSIGELGSPSFYNSKGKEREQPLSVVSPRGISPPGTDLPILTDLSSSPQKSVRSPTNSTAGNPRRHGSISRSRRSSPAQPSRSSARTSATPPPRREPERKCSVVVKDGDGEDKMWLMSEEALRDVKGYLQVKKAAGTVIEVCLGGEEGDARRSRLRVESSPRLTRKRSSSPEDDNEEVQESKRRRSWPGVNLYASKPHKVSPLRSD